VGALQRFMKARSEALTTRAGPRRAGNGAKEAANERLQDHLG